MLTTMVPRVLQDALAPDALEVDVQQGDPINDPDPGTATAASMHIRLPDGEEVTWTATLAATPGLATVKHPFVTGDLPMKGDYTVAVKLTLPDGVHACAPRIFRVVDEWDTSGAPPGPARVQTLIA